MQVSKSYSGNIASVGSATARQASYGADANITTYQNRVDFVNQTIADFLSTECGVDAAYEVRAGSSAKFLWIFGVPFLFANASATSYYFGFYGPFNATVLNTGSTSSTNTPNLYSLFFPNNNSGTDYNFTLYFDGDPDAGFVLRIRIRTAAISNGFFFAFLKATNIINGKNAVVWKYSLKNSSEYFGYYANGIDINEDGTMDLDSFSPTPVDRYVPRLSSKAIDKTSNPGKFPLVPVLFGVWQAENIYQQPGNFGLPEALTTITETQAAIEIMGRKFIITCSDSSTAAYLRIDLGLIESPG